MSYSFQNPSAEVIESYLKSAKTIAIVGLSHRKEAASYQVAAFPTSCWLSYHTSKS